MSTTLLTRWTITAFAKTMTDTLKIFMGGVSREKVPHGRWIEQRPFTMTPGDTLTLLKSNGMNADGTWELNNVVKAFRTNSVKETRAVRWWACWLCRWACCDIDHEWRPTHCQNPQCKVKWPHHIK